jgi:hypothetical protein
MATATHTTNFNESIRKLFTDVGCELLSEYVNRRTKVKYRCSCGNVAEIRIDSFQAGTRCRGCLSQRIKAGMDNVGFFEKQKAANLEKYGVENYFQSEDFKEKSKKTLHEKYGVENISKNPEMKQKIKVKLKEANQKKFGVDFLMQSKEFRDKAKQTNIERYGVDNIMKLAKFREKAYQTCIQKYGIDPYEMYKIFLEKAQKTNLERFGYTNPMYNKEIVEKAKITSVKSCMEKYGVPYIEMVTEVKNKMIATNLEKYGVEFTLQNPDIYEKTRKTLYDKYGIDNIGYASHVPELLKKKQETCMDRYGTIFPMQNNDIAEKSMKNVFKKKIYTLPSGKQIEIQGYENFAFDALVTLYDENKIKNNRSDMPEIWYCMDDGKYRYYHPDIYIADEKLIIEVKSPYTYYVLDYKKTDYKRKSVEALGYRFKLLIFNYKGELLKGNI